MKKLLLLLALLTFSAASFADGSVICEDRTGTDAVQDIEPAPAPPVQEGGSTGSNAANDSEDEN